MNLPKIRFNENNQKNLLLEKNRTYKTLTSIVNVAVSDRYQDIPSLQFLDMFCDDGIFRMRDSNTSVTKSNLVKFIHSSSTHSLIFGVRPDELNERCLVAYFEFGSFDIVCDKIMNNNQRTPRMSEIEQIFIAIDESINSMNAKMFMKVLPDTRDLSDKDALQIFKDQPTQEFNLKQMLIMLTSNNKGDNFFDIIDIKKYQSKGHIKLRVYKTANERWNNYEEQFTDIDAAYNKLTKMTLGQIPSEEKSVFIAEIIENGQMILSKNFSEITLM